MHWLRNIRSGSRVICSIESARLSRIEVPRVDYEKLSGDRVGESSECIRARVQAARDIQNRRFSKNGSSDIVCNADMRVRDTSVFQITRGRSKPDAGGDDAAQPINAGVSPHPFDKLRASVKLAPVIAGLAGAPSCVLIL